MPWYERSGEAQDTHLGVLGRGVVDAACGVRFRPRVSGWWFRFGRRRGLSGVAVAAAVEPRRVCARCLLAETAQWEAGPPGGATQLALGPAVAVMDFIQAAMDSAVGYTEAAVAALVPPELDGSVRLRAMVALGAALVAVTVAERPAQGSELVDQLVAAAHALDADTLRCLIASAAPDVLADALVELLRRVRSHLLGVV